MKKRSLWKTICVLFMLVMTLFILLILYLCWRLFAWLVNSIGVKGIRNKNGRLETAVVFYHHPKTKKQVVFIATLHLAEREYYAALQQRITALPGHQILFEGVGKLSAQEEQALTEKEHSVAKHFDDIFGWMRKIGELMSLQYQKEGLTYDSSWINTDIRLSELIRSFARHDIYLTNQEKKIDSLFCNESAQFTKWFINKLFSRFVPGAVLIDALAFLSRKKRLAKKFILDARNTKAVRGINEHLKNGNIVTIWGAAHIRGIERELKRSGFRAVRREWFAAYHVRDYNLVECFRTLLTASHATTNVTTTIK